MHTLSMTNGANSIQAHDVFRIDAILVKKKYQYIFIFGLFECIEFALFHLFTLDIMGVGIGAKKGGVVEKTEIKAFN